MKRYTDQAARIRTKLEMARNADPGYQVFGASSHRYILHPPATEEQVQAFERAYGIVLPGCYRAFVTLVGNGGVSTDGSGAGPFYGIYPLGGSVGELMSHADVYLKDDPKIFPSMLEEYWKALIGEVEGEDPFSCDVTYVEGHAIFGGILPAGAQGCGYLHGILLSGPWAGRVVNLDGRHMFPVFAFEDNFLDWYERWLDEVIAGELIDDGPFWFGYRMGGTAQELFEKYQNAAYPIEKEQCLRGLHAKKEINFSIIKQLANDCEILENSLFECAIRIVAARDFGQVNALLKQKFAEDPWIGFEMVSSYGKAHAHSWIPEIQEVLSESYEWLDSELFGYVLNVAQDAGLDVPELVRPFLFHRFSGIRSQAAYVLKPAAAPLKSFWTRLRTWS